MPIRMRTTGGEYNYIKPDESIESVINKLNRKLKWQSIDEK
jgi:hypothetical protein